MFNFPWRYISTTAMQPFFPHGHADPFLTSNEPENAHTPYFADDHVLQLTISFCILICDFKNAKSSC